MSAQPPYRPPTSPPPGYPPQGSGRGSSRALVIAVAVVVLAIVGGVAYWLGGRDSDSTPTAGVSSPSAAATTPGASSVPSAPASGPASTVPSTVASAPGATSAAPAATTGAPSTSASPTHTASPSISPFTHPDPDFGYVTGVTTAGAVTKLSFDRATLETGPAAASAAAAHGQTVEDDYFIVNDNKLIRTFVVAPAVVVTGSINLSGTSESKPSTLAALRAWLAAHPSQHLPVDLSYDAAGKVTKVAEVFFP